MLLSAAAHFTAAFSLPRYTLCVISVLLSVALRSCPSVFFVMP